MRLLRTSLTIFGLLLTFIGLIWIGQGSGYFPYPASSFMIDQRPWMMRGALVVITGLAVIFGARRLIK